VKAYKILMALGAPIMLVTLITEAVPGFAASYY
jgi:hypothetical protein